MDSRVTTSPHPTPNAPAGPTRAQDLAAQLESWIAFTKRHHEAWKRTAWLGMAAGVAAGFALASAVWLLVAALRGAL